MLQGTQQEMNWNKENIDAYSEYVKALQSNDKALASSLMLLLTRRTNLNEL